MDYFVGEFGGGGFVVQVWCGDLIFVYYEVNCFVYFFCVVVVFQVFQYYCCVQYQGGGVGDVLFGDVWCVVVYGFEDVFVFVYVGVGCQIQVVGEVGVQVGENVVEQVGGYDYVEVVWVYYQLYGVVVDDYFFVFDVVVFFGDGVCYVQEQVGCGFYDVGFVYYCDFVVVELVGCFIGEVYQVFGFFVGDYVVQFGVFVIVVDGLVFVGVNFFDVFVDGDDVYVVVV